MLNRRDFVKAASAGAVTLVLPNILLPETRGERPNVLVIITDQQHAGMMSCAGNPWLRTPNMDSLAARGTRFERAYCCNPVCSPSRFGMMTGTMPSRIGMERNWYIERPIPEDVLRGALGRVFSNAGYLTAYAGKTHLPISLDEAPFTSERARSKSYNTKLVGSYGFKKLLTLDSREGLATKVAAFLREKRKQPFLLVASFVNPHDICYMAIESYEHSQGREIQAPKMLAEALALPPGMTRDQFFLERCPPLPVNFGIPEGEPEAVGTLDWRPFRQYVRRHWSEAQWRLHRWAYARLTECVDAEIGRLLQALRASKREEDTVVVLVSDHGDLDGAHRLEHKSQLYEEAVRVPLIVSWRGVTKAGGVEREHLVSTGLDLIPTLCDFAGIPTPSEVQGRSVRVLAEGRAPRDWREMLVVENEGSRLVTWAHNKYMVYAKGEKREQLVDLEKDPGEMKNLAQDPAYQERRQEGRRLLERWYDQHGLKLDTAYIINSGSVGAG